MIVALLSVKTVNLVEWTVVFKGKAKDLMLLNTAARTEEKIKKINRNHNCVPEQTIKMI